MTDIELPTYTVIRPNELFGKNSDMHHTLKIPVKLSDVLFLKRFKMPSQEEVIRFIQESARDFDTNPFGKIELGNQKPLTAYLDSLSTDVVKNISNGHVESLDSLREHSPESILQRGEVYLEASNILIPSHELNLFPKEGSVINLPSNWSIKFKLLKGGKLPDRAELDYLVDRGVKDSDVFIVQGNFGDYERVANQIRILSGALGSSESIAQVKDYSPHFLEEEASLTVGRFLQGTSITDAIGGLSSIVQQIVEGVGKETPPDLRGDYSGFGGDPSRN